MQQLKIILLLFCLVLSCKENKSIKNEKGAISISKDSIEIKTKKKTKKQFKSTNGLADAILV